MKIRHEVYNERDYITENIILMFFNTLLGLFAFFVGNIIILHSGLIPALLIPSIILFVGQYYLFICYLLDKNGNRFRLYKQKVRHVIE